jgi:hypothetical protein
MSIIEVNLAGFQFVRCVPDGSNDGRHAWHVSRVHHMPRLHMRRRAPQLRVA